MVLPRPFRCSTPLGMRSMKTKRNQDTEGETGSRRRSTYEHEERDDTGLQENRPWKNVPGSRERPERQDEANESTKERTGGTQGRDFVMYGREEEEEEEEKGGGTTTSRSPNSYGRGRGMTRPPDMPGEEEEEEEEDEEVGLTGGTRAGEKAQRQFGGPAVAYRTRTTKRSTGGTQQRRRQANVRQTASKRGKKVKRPSMKARRTAQKGMVRTTGAKSRAKRTGTRRTRTR